MHNNSPSKLLYEENTSGELLSLCKNTCTTFDQEKDSQAIASGLNFQPVSEEENNSNHSNKSQLSESSNFPLTTNTTKGQEEKFIEKPGAFETLMTNMFGDLIPYGDPSWYQGWCSPYYTESHHRFREAVREHVEREIMPYCHEWDEAKFIPKEIYQKIGKEGYFAVLARGLAKNYVPEIKFPGNIGYDEYDDFHSLILTDELARCGSGGVMWAISGGLSIGLPPVLHFGPEELQKKVVPPCLRGEKIICLAITEPQGGSDVANLSTTAELTEDGKYYIVNGEKKWITNGVFADYFTTAVRTGGPGPLGVSLLLIERSPGVKTTQMKCSGVWPSGTSYVTFEDVKVPVENLIGVENIGFSYIMMNFNNERWGMCVSMNRFSRVCLEESIKYGMKRKTFGKKLIDHPVIRAKLGNMARQIDANQAWIENITYQFGHLTKKQQSVLGGPIAICKVHCSKTFEYCAREAAQIFGGLSYTRGGQGEKVERLYREVRAYAIPGGSEEIMLDLGVRQAFKKFIKAKY